MKGKFKELLMDSIKKGNVIDKDSLEFKAKSDILKEMKDILKDGVKNKVKGFQKVTVAAPDKESLIEGLEKASDVLEGEESEDEMDSSEKERKLRELMAKQNM